VIAVIAEPRWALGWGRRALVAFGILGTLIGVSGAIQHYRRSVSAEFRRGVEAGRLFQVEAVQTRSRIEARILAVIVERNPGATIRDFGDFPVALLAESERAGIDFAIVMAIIDKESQFNPRAIGSAGEIGLMQLMPATAKLIAERMKIDFEPPVMGKGGKYTSLGSLADPKQNVRLGIIYLRDLKNKHGMGAVALRAYNRGPSRALDNRPGDRYAEDVGIGLVAMIGKLR